MTREEAIEQLQDAKIGYKEYLSDDALDIAIKALKQEHCDDTINRKAVYEQINSWIGSGEYRYTNTTYYLMKRIRDIPSVT